MVNYSLHGIGLQNIWMEKIVIYNEYLVFLHFDFKIIWRISYVDLLMSSKVYYNINSIHS